VTRTPARKASNARVSLTEGRRRNLRLALRRGEAAEVLGLSDESFDRYVRPYVRCVRLGSLVVYLVAELERFLSERASAPIEGLER
jgi:hypothetical protein